MKKKFTIYSEYYGVVTIREIYDHNGIKLEPLSRKKTDYSSGYKVDGIFEIPPASVRKVKCTFIKDGRRTAVECNEGEFHYTVIRKEIYDGKEFTDKFEYRVTEVID